MASEYGLTTQSDTLNQLIIQDCIIHPLLIDSLVTVAHGQVVQYNTTNDNWDAYTSGMAASLYAVIAEARTIGADALCQCIVSGVVRKSALDATAQADAEIDVALLKSGIVPQSSAVRTS
jgi:hypothetical protein